MTLPQSTRALISATDWQTTALGPREHWPLELQYALGVCLNTRFPSVIFWGRDYLQLYNDAAAEALGVRHPAALGQAARECWPDAWATLGPVLDAIVAGGGATYVDECSVPSTGGGGPSAYFTISHSPIEAGLSIGGVLSIGVDITASVLRRRADRADAREREFLSEASRLLAESLDLHTTLHNIARLTIPEFADWCQIDLRTAAGEIKTVAIAHRDPRKDLVAQEFVGRIHLNPDYEHGQAYVIRTGCSDVIEELPAAVLSEAVDDQGELARYQRLGIRSFVSVPLVVQGRTLGAIAAVYGDSGRRYSAADLPLLEELGRRAGLAVQNAADFGREHRVAQSFQEASLPAELPRVPGLSFDAMYVPASEEAQIGGDWYDAMRLLDGRIVVSIGDVAGKGLRAAVTMGNMRQIIRGIAQVHADPALMLDAADRALRLEHPGQFVTAFVGVFDPIAKTFAYASAGHPPPLLRFLDGRVEALSDGGLPLGLREGRESTAGKVIDASNAGALVLYTDGLTELFRKPVDGEARLRALVAEGTVLANENPAQALKHAFFEGASAQDDVAILVVVLVAASAPAGALPALQHWIFDSSHALVVQSVRHEIGAGLSARGAAFEDVYAAEMVFGELVGNIVRYAPGRAEVSIDWSAAAPVLHVLDRGPGFRHMAMLPPDLFSESGRGLFLVATLTDDFHVSRRPDGGSHARAVLTMARTRLERTTRIGSMFLDNIIGAT